MRVRAVLVLFPILLSVPGWGSTQTPPPKSAKEKLFPLGYFAGRVVKTDEEGQAFLLRVHGQAPLIRPLGSIQGMVEPSLVIPLLGFTVNPTLVDIPVGLVEGAKIRAVPRPEYDDKGKLKPFKPDPKDVDRKYGGVPASLTEVDKGTWLAAYLNRNQGGKHLAGLVFILGKGPQQETGSALTALEVEEVVEFHNKVRKDVGVGPLDWSPALAKFAQEWADQLAETGEIEHRPKSGPFAQKYGENLAFHETPLRGAECWYGEIEFYKYGEFKTGESFGQPIGHYTQMVWRTSTRVGMGKARIKTGKYQGYLAIVANYNPPGNVIGKKPY